MGKRKFNQEWCNQTELGKKFGISAIEVGKLLAEYELRDLSTKSATEKAIKDEYAKFTPLKDGTPFYMWNIRKCKKLISQEHEELNKVDLYADEIRTMIKEAERLDSIGQDKMAYFIWDGLYDDVPKEFREAVKAKIENEGKQGI